jgi:hypothetical protein
MERVPVCIIIVRCYFALPPSTSLYSSSPISISLPLILTYVGMLILRARELKSYGNKGAWQQLHISKGSCAYA